MRKFKRISFRPKNEEEKEYRASKSNQILHEESPLLQLQSRLSNNQLEEDKEEVLFERKRNVSRSKKSSLRSGTEDIILVKQISNVGAT